MGTDRVLEGRQLLSYASLGSALLGLVLLTSACGPADGARSGMAVDAVDGVTGAEHAAVTGQASLPEGRETLAWCDDLHPPRAEPSGPISTDRRVAEDQWGRAQWGLASDEASTRDSMQASDPSRPFGFATTEAEFDQLMSQGGGATAEEVDRYGQDRPEQYAGLWVDQTRGGVVTAGFTGPLEPHRAALMDLVAPAEVAVVSAQWSLKVLETARDRIEFDMLDDRDSLPWASLAVDVKANRVMLGLSKLDEDIARTVVERYGDLPVCLDSIGALEPVDQAPGAD